jgi:hypothetical protein
MCDDLYDNMFESPFGDVTLPTEYDYYPLCDAEWDDDKVASAEYAEIVKGNLYVAGLHALWTLHKDWGHDSEARELTNMITVGDFRPLLGAKYTLLMHHARLTYVALKGGKVGSDTFRRYCQQLGGGNLILDCYIRCFRPLDQGAAGQPAERCGKRKLIDV